jgi:hypothetical protein
VNRHLFCKYIFLAPPRKLGPGFSQPGPHAAAIGPHWRANLSESGNARLVLLQSLALVVLILHDLFAQPVNASIRQSSFYNPLDFFPVMDSISIFNIPVFSNTLEFSSQCMFPVCCFIIISNASIFFSVSSTIVTFPNPIIDL